MTKICPDCKATVHSTSNRMGTTPEMQKMYDEFGGEAATELVRRFEHESMALHKTQREWLVREIGTALAAAPAVGGEREALAEAVRLFENYGLIAGLLEGDPLAAGRWINQARAVLAQPASTLRADATVWRDRACKAESRLEYMERKHGKIAWDVTPDKEVK